MFQMEVNLAGVARAQYSHVRRAIASAANAVSIPSAVLIEHRLATDGHANESRLRVSRR